MNEDLHAQARRLMDKDRVEGLAMEDRIWLEAHLGECDDCRRWSGHADATLRALINLPVALPSGLAAATSFRVRREAEALKQRRLRNLGLAVGCTLSWVLGVASAPLVWKVCAWLGAEFDLPRAVWILGFAAWWLVPVSAGALLILWQRDRLEREPRENVFGRFSGPEK
jgi:predicted anti-sigma-YlaC factor YlaD